MRSLRLFLALVLLAPAIPAGAQSSPASTTVILVRHGEKMAEPAADPLLTAAGSARAEALAAALKGAHVDAIVTTQFQRTRLTAAPEAASLGLTPEVVDARAPSHAQAVADAVLKHRGQTVLVVGHSNTVPAIVAALGAPKPADICDGDYDDLFVVTIPAQGVPRVVHAKYGAPARDAGCAAMK
jgi:broad specificity phosphatase PhoE